MTHQIRYTLDGTYQVYATANGIDRTDVGPRWQTPDAASIYCDALDQASRTGAQSEDSAPSSGLSVPLSLARGCPRAPQLPARAVPHRATGRDNPSA